jgi:hypothetical protein
MQGKGRSTKEDLMLPWVLKRIPKTTAMQQLQGATHLDQSKTRVSRRHTLKKK